MRAMGNVFATAMLVLFAQQAVADPYAAAPAHDPAADWCTEELPYTPGLETYQPDGAVTQVGPYLFRVCQRAPLSSTPERRVMRFFYNPERVEGLSSVKVMSGLIVNSLVSWERRVARISDSYRLTGEERIGSANYGVYRLIGPDGMIGRPMYVYLPDPDKGSITLPSHMFDCTEMVIYPHQLRGICKIHVGYNEIYTNLLFMSPLPKDFPIPVDRFPEFAQDVWRTLEAADVTNDYNTLPADVPFLD
ncbi:MULTISPECIES: hypothetical protein [unclassified Yoonia]|uniref:hypothetical protein n=1 Tax=unclassified Yoonia TaxID=2629118 RepID=UPI002AFEDF0B|nr:MULTISPECIES: hypothetical protein [unclassified Yoonia]